MTTLLQTQFELLHYQNFTGNLSASLGQRSSAIGYTAILAICLLLAGWILLRYVFSQGREDDKEYEAGKAASLRYQQEVEEAFASGSSDETPITNRKPPTSLTFKDLTFKVKNPDGSEKSILEPCSGHFPPDELVAIMGPSGSGKSTLLDMLANKKTAPYSGEIKINGQPRDDLFQRIAAYVGQEDVMPQFWTVKEAVTFNMELKGFIPDAVKDHADDLDTWPQLLLKAFGLNTVQDTFIGGPKVRGISGGQRRRLSLARGLASGAMVLFCDEPTSGLSATDAEACVKALRIIAKKFGTLVVVVIHQPRVEVANLFDRLVLLTSEPGRMVYNGPMKSSVSYWDAAGHSIPESSNPTDVFLDSITPRGPEDDSDKFVELFQKNQKPDIDEEVAKQRQRAGMNATEMLAFDAKQMATTFNLGEVPPPRLSKFASPFTTQVQALFRRKAALTLKDRSAIGTLFVFPIAIRTLFGVLYAGIGTSALLSQVSPFCFVFFLTIILSGMQLMSKIIDERLVMKYETSEALYSTEAYIIGHLVVDSIIALISAMIGSTILFACTLLPWSTFPTFLGYAVLQFLYFDSLNGSIASFAATGEQAVVIALAFNPVFITFSGFMQAKTTAPFYMKWAFEISPVAYAIEGVSVRLAPLFQDGASLCAEQGFDAGNVSKGIIVILSSVSFFKFVQFLGMKYRNDIQK